MKIGIITFHASHNYGSMLQAWALQTFLEKRGHQVEIVNYRSQLQKAVYHKPISFARWDVALATFKRMLLYPKSIPLLNEKWQLFENFLQNELNITNEYHSVEELQKARMDYDLLICGSDQIWNTGAPDCGEAYFGNWFSGKKISYAASLGPEPEKCDSMFLEQQINDFDAVSVREQRSLDYLIEQRIVKNGCVVCDPTLLLDGDDYNIHIDDEPLIQGDYVFFYTPVGLPHQYFKIASEIGREMGCLVVTEKAYYPKDIKRYGNVRNYIPTGPSEFLNLIRYAKCVCGGSFHLQVFSILFHKDFYCINGDKDSRTNHLLKQLGLESRIIRLDNPEMLALSSIQYGESVVHRLYNYRENSLQFITNYIHV